MTTVLHCAELEDLMHTSRHAEFAPDNLPHVICSESIITVPAKSECLNLVFML